MLVPTRTRYAACFAIGDRHDSLGAGSSMPSAEPLYSTRNPVAMAGLAERPA